MEEKDIKQIFGKEKGFLLGYFCREYATWRIDNRGILYDGHYFQTRTEAEIDFHKRVMTTLAIEINDYRDKH